MMIGRIALISLASLALWGCGSSDDSSSKKAVEKKPAVEMDRIYLFDCGQSPVKAIYHGQDSMTLYLDRNQYELFPSVAASGARYATPAESRQQITFWSKGNEATLERAGSPSAFCKQVGEATTEPTKKKKK